MVLWAGNVLHHADLGGIDEGSFCVNATNVFQEAPRYFLKIVEAGRLSREVERTFTTNSRLSEMVAHRPAGPAGRAARWSVSASSAWSPTWGSPRSRR